MKKVWDPQSLDVRAFARDGATVSGVTPWAEMPRLGAEQTGPSGGGIAWTLSGYNLDLKGGAHQTWMRVQAEAGLRLVCQRCLEPLDQPLEVDRHFRFVSSEQAAEAEDDQAEEDLLVASHAFNGLTLIEDELILSLPLVPRHNDCQAPTG